MDYDVANYENMVLVSQKEQRAGDSSPLGTIHYTHGGVRGSLHPGDHYYAFGKSLYTNWKRRQTDQARKKRDKELWVKQFSHLEATEQKDKRLSLYLPGHPPALVHMDDLSIPFLQFYQAETNAEDVTARVTLDVYRERYGCYWLQSFYDKVKPGGTIGRRQEERGRLLRDRLTDLVTTQLLAAGWRIAFDEPGKWRFEGNLLIEQEERLARIALRTWRGRADRVGNEKVAELVDDPLLFETIACHQWKPVAGNERLDYLIDPDALQIHVRRRHIVPTPQEQQRTATTLELAIVGDQEARERGAAPAYHRTITTRPVTFLCVGCKQTVTQERLPGPTPRYCSDICRDEAQRQKTLERVQRLRDKRKINKQSVSAIV